MSVCGSGTWLGNWKRISHNNKYNISNNKTELLLYKGLSSINVDIIIQ